MGCNTRLRTFDFDQTDTNSRNERMTSGSTDIEDRIGTNRIFDYGNKDHPTSNLRSRRYGKSTNYERIRRYW